MRLRVIALALLLAACGPKGKTGPGAGSANAPKTLYDRLGGRDALIGIVEDFLSNVAADKRIAPFFQGVDTQGLRQKLVDQLCEQAGGPCKYTGRDMAAMHDGMAIKQEHWDAFVDDLQRSLDKFKVAEPEAKDLLAIIAKMHDAIVTAK